MGIDHGEGEREKGEGKEMGSTLFFFFCVQNKSRNINSVAIFIPPRPHHLALFLSKLDT